MEVELKLYNLHDNSINEFMLIIRFTKFEKMYACRSQRYYRSRERQGFRTSRYVAVCHQHPQIGIKKVILATEFEIVA